MEFRILGPLEVRDGAGVTPLPRRRERALLAALVLRPGEVVSTDRLVEAIWGQTPPRTAVGSLQNAVSELRKALGTEVVVTRSPGYVLAIEPQAVDAVRFERAVRSASALDAAERAEALSGALALWRGPALADLADEPFARTEATRLDELRLAAVEERIAADLELGRGAELVPELEAHVAANPLRERLRGQLMLSLYRSGRQAEALEAYQDARRALVDGLGIDPSPALQELERRILRQDPELVAAEAVRATPAVGEPPLRKTVTVLAAALDDVSELDPETLRTRVDRFLAAVREITARHGGALDRFLGSEAVAVFGVPLAHEDDALRATRAAVELRETAASDGETVRVGIATGEALVDTGDTPVVGDVVACAATMRDAAAGGGVVVSATTHVLVRDAVTAGDETLVGPRGLVARPVEAVQGARGRARRLDTPFVGRERELTLLRDALGRATEERRCVAVTVVGEAGIGKTRVAEQLAAMLVRGRLLHGQCLSYGAGTAFAPILEIVARVSGELTEDDVAPLLRDSEDAARAAGTIATLADPHSAVPLGEAFWAVRRVIESLARDDPLVLVLDDIQWAEATLLDLVEYLGQRVAASVVLLCLSRPELLHQRPDWSGGDANMSVVTLGPLENDDAGVLLGRIGDHLADRERDRILERADGNPLHLEQLAAFATEGGDLSLDDVPPSLEAVLASRVDQLSSDARDTLQRASITQRGVWRGLVVALSEPGARVDASLLELTRRGFLHAARSEEPDDLYRFHHALLRDVAYRSLPKAVRSVLHERAAAWWVDTAPVTPDDLVGWHLERAHDLRAELRPHDPALPVLAQAAGERLAAAGLRHTRARDPAAVDLLQRASRLLPAVVERADALLELGVWHRIEGDNGASDHAFEEAQRVATSVGSDDRVARARMELAWNLSAIRTSGSMNELRELVTELLPTLEATRNERGLMRAWQYITTASLFEMRYAEMELAAHAAIDHAHRAGWSGETGAHQVMIALVHGPRPVDESLALSKALSKKIGESRQGLARIATAAACLHAMTGDDAMADALLAESHGIFVESRDRLMMVTAWLPNRLTVLRLRGEGDAAIDLAGAWAEQSRRDGNDAYLSTALACLASLTREDATAPTEAYLREAADRASADDLLVQSMIRSVSAVRTALSGDLDSARRLVDEAGAILEGSDALCDRARVLVDRSRVLELARDASGSEASLDEARGLLEAKGNVRGLAAIDEAGTKALM